MKEKIRVNNQRYRLGYHLMTSGGWMNDPNGFSWFKGYYHMFYQYYPYAAEWGPMHWGHARSKDLVHWETLPVALTPDEAEDGCFSGSAVVYEDKLWLIYTGHHLTDPADSEAFYQDQNLAWSEDGVHFVKYEGNPVLQVPADNTKHFRDPKVWQEAGNFYMVLGSQGKDGLGRALLYQSKDLKQWEKVSVLAKAANVKSEGYMWECPDFFPLMGQDVLLMSPQGVEAQGDRFRNLNQTGYMLGQVTDDKAFIRGQFEEIDHGHDFYATQTMLAPDGRRIMVAWMNAWDSPMYEKTDGWAGALTIPRELSIKDNHIYQRPIQEMQLLREKKIWDGNLAAGKQLAIPRTAEVELVFGDIPAGKQKLLELSDGQQTLSLEIDRRDRRLTLRRTTEDGERSLTMRSAAQLDLKVFIDNSSAELFVNEGEFTFTERIYWQNDLTMQLPWGAEVAKVYALEAQANQY
jgi:beta-fructofuranosidase